MKKVQVKKTNQQKVPLKKDATKDMPLINNKYFNWLGIGIMLLLGVIIYSNSFNCSFHLDDTNSIVENTKIRDLSDIQGIWKYGGSRFIGYLSFAVNYHYGQLNVWGYHLFNLLVHLFTSVIAWCTLLMFATPYFKGKEITKHKNILALLVGLLFVSHPLATQSVTYIVQRLASMVSMFYLLSMALYLKGRLTNNNISKYILFAGSFIVAVLGLFTKQNAYTLPFGILLLEIFFFNHKILSFKAINYRVIIFAGCLIGFIVFAFYRYSSSIFRIIPPSDAHSYVITSSGYLFSQFSVIIKYMQLLLLPIQQNVDYDFPYSTSFFEVRTLLSFLFLIAILGLAVFLFKKNRMISFGIFWFFLTLSVESSFIPIDDIIFEHRTYLPSFGFFLVIILGVYSLLWNKYKFVGMALLFLVVGSNSVLAFNRNKVWISDFSLWNDAAIKSPNKARPILNRGTIYADREEWQLAISDQSKAIEINPKFVKAYANRGVCYSKVQQYDQAIEDYSKVIELGSSIDKNEIVYYNRAVAYEKFNEWNKAIKDYTKVVEIDPKFLSGYFNRGYANSMVQQWDESINDYSKAIELDSKNPKYFYNRGIIYDKIGKLDEAIADYTAAINGKAEHKEAYLNRGVCYAKQGQWDKAIIDYSKALQIDPKYSLAQSNLDIAKKNLNNRKK